MDKRFLWIGTALGLVAVAGAIYLSYFRGRDSSAVPPAAATAQPDLAPEVLHPVAAPDSPAAGKLPPLADSDAAMTAALAETFGAEKVQALLVPTNVVRRIVATVDSLTRSQVNAQLRPVVPTAGAFATSGPEDRPVLSAENFGRYAPFVTAFGALDARALAATYRSTYPLFQEAYRDLGYPKGYFNDRLVQVIDHVLAAPEVSGDIALVRPSVYYQFADPKLEALSAGHKIMIRMGSANAAIVKAKLKEIRAEVAARTP